MSNWLRRSAPVVETTSGALRPLAIPQPDRLKLDWTPAQVRTASTSADSGNFRALSDLCLAIGRDPRVAGVLSTRTVGQVSLDRKIRGAGEPGKWWRRHWDQIFPAADLSAFVWWGLMAGFAIAHLEIEVDDLTGEEVPRLVVWDPRWIRLEYGKPGDPPRWLAQTADGHEAEITPGDGVWLMFTPYGDQEPWRRGLWNALALPWLMKTFALHDRAKHSEINGSPTWVAKTKGLSQRQRRSLLADLRAMARNAKVVLPEDCDLSLIEATGRTWEIYSTAVDWADREMSISIAGQVVTTEGTTGFSNGNIHGRILSTFIKGTANALVATLRIQGMVPTTRWFFGAAVEIPTVEYVTDPPEDIQKKAASIQSVGQAITALDTALQPHGKRLNVKRLFEQFEIPIEDLPTTIATAEPEPIAAARLFRAASRDLVNVRATGQSREIPLSADGEPPREFMLFAFGPNEADDGLPAVLTRENAERIVANRGTRRLMIDLEHLSLDKDRPAALDPHVNGLDPRGWASLEVRDDGLWCVDVVWLPDGERRLREKLQPYTSPAFWTDEKGEIVDVLNVAITATPATIQAVQLVAASRGKMNIFKLLRSLGMKVTDAEATKIVRGKTLAIRAYDQATIEKVLKALGLPADIPKSIAAAALTELAAALEGGGSGETEAPAEEPAAVAAEGMEEEETAVEAAEGMEDEAVASRADGMEEEEPAAAAKRGKVKDPIAELAMRTAKELERMKRDELYRRYSRSINADMRVALDALSLADAERMCRALPAPPKPPATPAAPQRSKRQRGIIPEISDEAIQHVARAVGRTPDQIRADFAAQKGAVAR